MESPVIYSNLPVPVRHEISSTGTGPENALETSFITEPCENENVTDGMTFGFWQTGTGFTYEIPDCLMNRDFIEVHGVCLGKQISFELCTREGQAKSNHDLIPLQVILNSSGQVTVMSRNKQKVEKQELFMKNCIQENRNFELCVYAYEDRYEVFLNKEKICAQKHVIELADVFALSMDGDAEFLSVEFKDLYWEDETASSKLDEPAPAGFVRVQEMRESARNKKGEQVMVPVRNSFRSSQQSKKGLGEVSAWQTSADLSKPYLDKDYFVEPSSSLTYNAEYRSNAEPQMYATMPSYGFQPSSDNDPAWPNNRGTMDQSIPTSKSKPTIGPSRKSITLSEERLDRPLSIGGDIHAGSYRPFDDQYSMSRGSTMATGTLISGSTPSLQEKSKKKRFSLLGRHRKSKGSEPDIRASVQQDSGSEVKLRKSKGSAADVRVKEDDDGKKKKKFHFKNIFKRKKSRDSAEITPTPTGSGTLNFKNPLRKDIHSNASITPIVAPSSYEQPKDLLKQPSAEMAAYLHNRNNNTHLTDTTLTGRNMSDIDLKLRRSSQDYNVGSPSSSKLSVTNDQVLSPHSLAKGTVQPTGTAVRSSSPPKVGKLKGSAAEMASVLYFNQPSKYEQEITLTEINHRGPLGKGTTAITREGELSPMGNKAAIKLSGNASEMASQILKSNPNLNGDDDKYHTNITGIGVLSQQKSPEYRRVISIDRDQENPVFKPDSNYVYSKNVQKSRQAVSLPDYQSDDENNISEGSTVYTDGEYYLEVGKSAYYFERKRSLKNYRSRRSVKQEKAARRQMGLSTGDSDSALSSISSLKPDDPTMTPNANRRRIGAGPKEVRSWLDNQTPEYSREMEVKIIPTAASTRVVYADAPSSEFDHIGIYSTKDVCETFKNKDMVEFTLPLIAGRKAIINGSFRNPVQQNIQHGLIKLSCSTQSSDGKQNGESPNNLFIEIWSNGHSVVFTKCGSEKKIICSSLEYPHLVLDSSKFNGSSFCISLTGQCHYLAVTRDDIYSLAIPESAFSNSPYAIQVEEPPSIILDQMVVVRCLILPLQLCLPPNSQGCHHLELITKLTADSEQVNIEYNSKHNDWGHELSVTMNLTQFKIYVTHLANAAVPILPADIPFVPEQIKSIDLIIFKEMDKCALKVQLNKKELVNSVLGPADLVNDLDCVRIEGNLELIDVQLKEII